MRATLPLAVVLGAVVAASGAAAQDPKVKYPPPAPVLSFPNMVQLALAPALSDPAYVTAHSNRPRQRIAEIDLFFGAQPLGSGSKPVAELEISTRPNWGSITGGDRHRQWQQACIVAFRAGLEHLAKEAKAKGADAVIAIRSATGDVVLNSESDFVCGSGGIRITGTAVERLAP